MLTICFTGRRPKDLCGYKQEGYNNFVGQLASYLFQFVDTASGEPTQFISGGAQGFDQLAFWAVDLLKTSLPESDRHLIINTVYVPFRGQDRIWKATGLFSRDQYNKMLAHADRVAYLREATNDRKAVVAALLSRNHMMVDASDQVIALYPGDDWRNVTGGTAECMRYAESKNKPITQVRYTVDNNVLNGVFA